MQHADEAVHLHTYPLGLSFTNSGNRKQALGCLRMLYLECLAQSHSLELDKRATPGDGLSKARR
jgi:hypothetical protein